MQTDVGDVYCRQGVVGYTVGCGGTEKGTGFWGADAEDRGSDWDRDEVTG